MKQEENPMGTPEIRTDLNHDGNMETIKFDPHQQSSDQLTGRVTQQNAEGGYETNSFSVPIEMPAGSGAVVWKLSDVELEKGKLVIRGTADQEPVVVSVELEEISTASKGALDTDEFAMAGNWGPKPEGEISRDPSADIEPAYAEFRQSLKDDLEVKTISSEPLDALSKEVVADVIDQQYNAIRYAYERYLPRNPGLSGYVVVSFTIGADGTVSRASIKESTLANSAVEIKVIEVFNNMKFPEPMGGGIVEVTLPIRYQPQE